SLACWSGSMSPNATTMTTGCPKGTRNRFAETFPPLCGRSPHSLVLHSVLLRIVQGWLDPDEVARWPGGEVFLSDQGTDNLFHLTVAEDVLHRVVCQRIGDRRHDHPLV